MLKEGSLSSAILFDRAFNKGKEDKDFFSFIIQTTSQFWDRRASTPRKKRKSRNAHLCPVGLQPTIGHSVLDGVLAKRVYTPRGISSRSIREQSAPITPLHKTPLCTPVIHNIFCLLYSLLCLRNSSHTVDYSSRSHQLVFSQTFSSQSYSHPFFLDDNTILAYSHLLLHLLYGH